MKTVDVVVRPEAVLSHSIKKDCTLLNLKKIPTQGIGRVTRYFLRSARGVNLSHSCNQLPKM